MGGCKRFCVWAVIGADCAMHPHGLTRGGRERGGGVHRVFDPVALDDYEVAGDGLDG